MIKKITVLAVGILFASLIVSSNISYADYTNDSDIDTLNSMNDALNNYVDALNTVGTIGDPTTSSVITSGQDLQSEITNLIDHNFATSVNTDYTSAASTLQQDANKIGNDVGQIDSALADQDVDAANSAITALNDDNSTFYSDYKNFNSIIDTYNQPIQSKNKAMGAFYIAVFVITGLVTAVTFIWAASAKNRSIRKLRMHVGRLSLWPSVGAALTTVMFYAAVNEGGGTYFILWGPILFGAIAYLRGIARYSSAIKEIEFEKETNKYIKSIEELESRLRNPNLHDDDVPELQEELTNFADIYQGDESLGAMRYKIYELQALIFFYQRKDKDALKFINIATNVYGSDYSSAESLRRQILEEDK